MRYWYLDGANHVTLLLVDKGYYDYDYERPEGGTGVGCTKTKTKTDKETEAMLARFGVGTSKRKSKAARGADLTRSVSASDLKNMDMERLQSYAMAQVGGATDAKR